VCVQGRSPKLARDARACAECGVALECGRVVNLVEVLGSLAAHPHFLLQVCVCVWGGGW
jgi:hypothetical protein